MGTAPESLSRIAVRVRVGLEVDGIRQPYPQDVAFTPTDPLTLAVAPTSATTAQAQIANPAGTPFSGTLSAAGPNGFLRVEVRLAAGTTAQVVSLPASAGQAWLLRDGNGRMIASLPARRIIPYPLVPPIDVVLDGDAKVPSSVQVTPDGAAQVVRYRYAPGWTFWRAGEAQPLPLPGKPSDYGVWVSGDGSGNNVNVRYLDSTGQTFQVKGPQVDWTGWRFLSFRSRPRQQEVPSPTGRRE